MSPASGLGLAQLKAQAHARDLAGDLATFQAALAAAAASGSFFRSVLDNCDLPIRTPSRASISLIRRAIVQLRRLATGASKRGVDVAQRGLALHRGWARAPRARLQRFNAAIGEITQRHRRTVSSRTPKASAMRGLVQPKSVSNIARARSASSHTVSAINAPTLAQRRTLLPIRRYWRRLPTMPPPPQNQRKDGITPAIRWQHPWNLLRAWRSAGATNVCPREPPAN